MNLIVPQQMPRSFADLSARAEADQMLGQAVRRNMVSALKRFGAVDGRGPALPCDEMTVRAVLRRANPTQHGISAGNWANIVALVRRAKRRYGAAAGKSLPNLLNPEWRALREAIVATQDPRPRLGLSRFIHWASGNNWMPHEIDDAALAAFHHHLTNCALLPDANNRYRDTCKLWNQACAVIKGWPQQRVVVPVFSKAFSLDWSELPDGLVNDLEIYCAVMGGQRLFDERPPANALKSSTLYGTRHAIRRLASAAILAGVAPDRMPSLAALLDRGVLEPALNWYMARLGGKAASLFEAVAKLVSIGRHYLKRSEDELAPLNMALKRLECRQRGMTPKNLERLRPFATARNLAAFVHMAGILVRKAASKGAKRQALAWQTALAHELLLCAPMRFSNLINLRIDQHLELGKDGKRATARIRIAAAEVKNKVDLTFEVTLRVAELLTIYLRKHRPLLCSNANNNFLFPGVGLDHLTTVSLGKRLCDAVRNHAGLAVNPHLYRHIAAFIYLQQHPGDYETVRQFLGHKSLATTLTFYTVLESWISQRAYHRVLDAHLYNPPA